MVATSCRIHPESERTSVGKRIGILLHRPRAEIDVTLKVDVDKERLFDELRREFSAIPGSSVTIGQPIGHRIDHSRAVNVMLP